jgi:aminoglycoside/choline kinase family phosphotransferase
VREWIEAELGKDGRSLTGPLDQFHVRHWSTVIRVPTAGGLLYFKAAPEQLAYEAALTVALARRHPDALPPVVAADAGRGWLLLGDGGQRLREPLRAEGSGARWQTLLPQYAEMQKDLASHSEELLALGVPDRRLAHLPEHLAMLIEAAQSQALPPPDGLSDAEYRRLETLSGAFPELCAALAAGPIPESLDHGDFHDGNVFWQNGRYTIFDWGDSGVAHPFFSLRPTFVSLENSLGAEKAAAWLAPLRDAYLAAWREYGAADALRATFRQAQRLAPLIAALRWRAALSLLETPGQSDYAHAAPSLLRELLDR